MALKCRNFKIYQKTFIKSIYLKHLFPAHAAREVLLLLKELWSAGLYGASLLQVCSVCVSFLENLKDTWDMFFSWQ